MRAFAPNALLASLAVLLASGLAGAARADGELTIPFEKLTLDNGLEVILHRDTTAPQITVNVWYHVGSGDEVPGKSGFAHLFEHMMFQGSKHTAEDVHFPTLQKVGGSDMNGTTNSDRTNYYETVPKNAVETALWLESDRMGFLLDEVTEKSFRNQVDVVRNERRLRYDNVPYGKARFAMAAALYPEGHPYRYMTIGLHEDIDKASLDDVRAFFSNWYVPSNATLVVAGDFDIDQMKALVVKWFGDFPKMAKPERRSVPMPTIAATQKIEVKDGFAKLVQIQRTWLAPEALTDDALALEAFGELVGAEGWGRLDKRLVTKDALATAVSVSYDGRMRNGEVSVIVQLKPGVDRKKVEKIIDEEMAQALAAPPTDAELHRVILGTESDFVWGLEEVARRADQLQRFNHYTGDPGYAKTYLARLRALTPAAVQAAAQKWLSQPYVQVTTIPSQGGK
ncbi:MAG: pitrilysin family protein [Myxococcota bacterium]